MTKQLHTITTQYSNKKKFHLAPQVFALNQNTELYLYVSYVRYGILHCIASYHFLCQMNAIDLGNHLVKEGLERDVSLATLYFTSLS